VQRVEETIKAYEHYLQGKGNPQPWMVEFIWENVERLTAEQQNNQLLPWCLFENTLIEMMASHKKEPRQNG